MSPLNQLFVLILLSINGLFSQSGPGNPLAGTFLHRVPIQLEFQYRLSTSEFEVDTTGIVQLYGENVFRLELWDRVYASDNSNLYIHDLNTRQTVIDSLRLSELHYFIQILQNDFSENQVVVDKDSVGDKVIWYLRSEEPFWSAEVEQDLGVDEIRTISITDENQWRHLITITKIESVEGTLNDSIIQLKDLPGIRLDLR